MAPLALIPDVEQLAANYLRTVPEITAIVGTRVYTAVPPAPVVWPLLRLERIGGTVEPLGWLSLGRLQVEAWADEKPDALDLARTALAVLLDLSGIRGEGVVSVVRQDLPLLWLPDPDTNRARYLFGVAIYAHPL